MQITVDVPDDLAPHLTLVQEQMPRISELGLRELNVTAQTELVGVPRVSEILEACRLQRSFSPTPLRGDAAAN